MSKTSITVVACLAAAALGWMAATDQLGGDFGFNTIVAIALGCLLAYAAAVLLLKRPVPDDSTLSTDQTLSSRTTHSTAATTTTSKKVAAKKQTGSASGPKPTKQPAEQVKLAPAAELVGSRAGSSNGGGAGPSDATGHSDASSLADSDVRVARSQEPVAVAEAPTINQPLAKTVHPKTGPISSRPLSAGPTKTGPTNGTVTVAPKQIVVADTTPSGSQNGPVPNGQGITLEQFRRSLDQGQAEAISDLVDQGLLSSEGPITNTDVETLTFMAVAADELVAMFADGTYVGSAKERTASMSEAARFRLNPGS